MILVHRQKLAEHVVVRSLFDNGIALFIILSLFVRVSVGDTFHHVLMIIRSCRKS